jgi:hypothetical protein
MGEHTKLTFTFSNQPHDLSSALSSIFTYIENQLPDSAENEPFLLSAKWSITELLTNAIKHGGPHETIFNISLDDQQLIIEKKDSGPPLSLSTIEVVDPLTWPLEDIHTEQHFSLQNYGNDLLRVFIDENCRAIFISKEAEEEFMNDPLESLSEHFGLLIITRSTDHFIYEYDLINQINIFRCILKRN